MTLQLQRAVRIGSLYYWADEDPDDGTLWAEVYDDQGEEIATVYNEYEAGLLWDIEQVVREHLYG